MFEVISSEYTGVFKLFATTPLWATTLFILVMTIVIPFVIADRTTGMFYNFSYSGVVGDVCLAIVVLVGATVLQREAPLPTWFASFWLQMVWLSFCLVVGIILVTVNTPWPIATWPDRYHNCVVVPLFMFFLPVAILAVINGGNWIEKISAVVLVLIWAVLVAYDFHGDRMNQPEYLTKKFGLQFQDGHLVPPANRN